MDRAFGIKMFIAIISISQADTGLTEWTCYQETGKCYYIPDFTLEQPEASCWCKSTGGHLVKIDSPAELALVRKLIEDEDRMEGFYIGATDKRNENKFVWEDGTEAGFNIPWHVWGDTSEPDNYNYNEHCVALTNKLWWEANPTTFPEVDALDVICSSKIYFMCEENKRPVISRSWRKVSRGNIYPSEELLSIYGVSAVTCAHYCTETCRCLSMSYRRESKHCILYNQHTSRLTTAQISPGYVYYD